MMELPVSGKWEMYRLPEKLFPKFPCALHGSISMSELTNLLK